MTDFAAAAHKLTALAQRIDTRVDHAAEWLTDHIADGYPTSTRGSEGAGGDPAHSPTLDAIPRQAQGARAQKIDYELKHSRCEGWAERHAICDDLDVKTTVVNGSTMRLCKRCYDAMWRATEDAGERGRIPYKERTP